MSSSISTFPSLSFLQRSPTKFYGHPYLHSSFFLYPRDQQLFLIHQEPQRRSLRSHHPPFSPLDLAFALASLSPIPSTLALMSDDPFLSRLSDVQIGILSSYYADHQLRYGATRPPVAIQRAAACRMSMVGEPVSSQDVGK